MARKHVHLSVKPETYELLLRIRLVLFRRGVRKSNDAIIREALELYLKSLKLEDKP